MCGIRPARDPIPLDMPDDPRQDPFDDADFKLPDQQALIDAFMNGQCKEKTMCPTTQSTPCWYPKERLIDPDGLYPFRDTEDIRERFAEERKKLLLSYGQPRDRCKAR